MKRVYIGIDAHKESNTVALAFAGNEPPEPARLFRRALHASGKRTENGLNSNG